MKTTTTVKTLKKGTTSGAGAGVGSGIGSGSRYVSSKTTRVISGGSGSQSGLRHSLRGSGSGKVWKKTVLGKKFVIAEKLKEKKNYLMYHSGMGHEKNVIEEIEQIPQPEEKEKIIEEREIIDNYEYHETKNIKKKRDPRRASITHHERLSSPFERTVVKKFSSNTTKPQQISYTTTTVKKERFGGDNGINKYNSFTTKQEKNKTVVPSKLYETYKPTKNITSYTQSKTTSITTEKKKPAKPTINTSKYTLKQKTQYNRPQKEQNNRTQTKTETTQDGDYLIKITTTKKQVGGGKPYGDQKSLYKSRGGSVPRSQQRPRNTDGQLNEENRDRPLSRPGFGGPHGPRPGFAGPHGPRPGFGGPHGPRPGFGGPHGPRPGFAGPHGPLRMPNRTEEKPFENDEDLLGEIERPKSLEKPGSFGRPMPGPRPMGGAYSPQKYGLGSPHSPQRTIPGFGPRFGGPRPGFGGPGPRPGFGPHGPGFGGPMPGFGPVFGPNGVVIQHKPTCPLYRASLEAERRALSQQRMIRTFNESTFSKSVNRPYIGSKISSRYGSQPRSGQKTFQEKKMTLTTSKKTTNTSGGMNKYRIQTTTTNSSEGGDNYNYYESKDIHKKRRIQPITIHHRRGELGAYIDDIPERKHHKSSSYNKSKISHKINLNNSNIVRNLNKPKVTSVNTNKGASKYSQKKTSYQKVKTSTTSGAKKSTGSSSGLGKSAYSEYRKYEQKGKVGGSTAGSSAKYKFKSSSDYKKGNTTSTGTSSRYQFNKTEYREEVPMYGSNEEQYQYSQSNEYIYGGNNMGDFSQYQYFDDNEYEIIDCPVHGRQTIRRNRNYNYY